MASSSQITESDLHTNCNNLLIYILNNATNKLPLKFADMTDLFGKHTKTFLQALPVVTDALRKDYGIIVKEVPDRKSGRKLICFVENTPKTSLEFDEEQKQHVTLLFIILSFIFMKGGNVYEEQLENFLKGLDIYYDELHVYFGMNVKKLITETFIKQLYLKKTKSESEFDTETKYLISWGYRADMEFKKMDLLNATAKILGKNAEFFQAQYNAACAGDEDEDSDEEMQN